MYRQREYSRITCKDRGRSISLMDIQIYNGCSLDPTFGSRPFNRNGEIVKDTETGSFVTKRVMRSSGERPDENRS